ncbi:glycosyltransferase family 2 protein [Geoalkalibacter halelectricus]|uniref:glycosyltransferase family 2 protein n=1 Tax=Geoalkalibacter halelectricus TaxID=2847045 RepID=UPI003D23440B
MRRPAVSILMPVRNEARHLPAALASVLRQSFTDWELVAVDDGSQDATAQILAEAARRDARVRVVTLAPSGLVAALNAGLAACRAPLTARMDGDDICHPLRLERQLDYLRAHPHTTVLGCAVRHFPRPALPDGMRAYERWQNALVSDEQIRRDLLVESPLVHPSVVFRTDAVTGAGGYRDAGWAEDYDLWLRLAARGARFAKVPQLLFFWRDRPERLTRTAPTCSAEAFRACKVHHLRQGLLKGAREVTLWGAGIEGKAWMRALGAAGVRVTRWIEVDPRKIGQTIHGAPVAPVDALHRGIAPVLVTIGAKGARAQVRDYTERVGLIEGRDFVCVT